MKTIKGESYHGDNSVISSGEFILKEGFATSMLD